MTKRGVTMQDVPQKQDESLEEEAQNGATEQTDVEEVETLKNSEASEVEVFDPEVVEADAIEKETMESEDQTETINETSPLETAEARIAELETEVEGMRSRLLRSHADMENLKKRNERERLDSIKYANKRIFLEFLEVLDNFDRALMAVTDPKDNFVIGVKMIHKQMLDVLSRQGVEEISAKGRSFDPYLDEALAQEPSDEHPENTIMEVFLKGYKFHGNLLRPTKVKVSVAPEPVTPVSEETPEAEDVQEENQEES